FVTGDDDGLLAIWSTNTGECVARLIGHSKGITSLVPANIFKQDQRIISGSKDFTIRLWKIKGDLGQTNQVLTGHTDHVTCCAFGPHDTHLATGSLDHSILLWNSLSGAHMNILVGHNAAVIDICYDSSGKILLSLAKDLCIRIWRPLSGETVLVLKQCCAMQSARFSPDASPTVSASEDGSLVLWDTARGQGLNVLTGHKGPVLACCFIDGHPSVISGGKDQRIRVWDVSEPAGGIMKAELSGHEGQITGLAPLGEVKTMIASCSTDKTWRIWDINRKEATRSLSGHTSGLTSLAITPCMDITLTTSLDFTARIW
ncbi:uncharacterized protein MICPUCDRAFT_10501, partial [Micromonas pusilla CCMP1545]